MRGTTRALLSTAVNAVLCANCCASDAQQFRHLRKRSAIRVVGCFTAAIPRSALHLDDGSFRQLGSHPTDRACCKNPAKEAGQ